MINHSGVVDRGHLRPIWSSEDLPKLEYGYIKPASGVKVQINHLSPISANLVSRVVFNEGTGSDVLDLATLKKGSANSCTWGTINGEVAIVLDGSSSYISIPDDVSYHFSGDATLAWWGYFNALNNDYVFISTKQSSNTPGQFEWRVNPNKNVELLATGGNHVYNGTPSVPEKTPVFLAMTVNSTSGVKIYVDGELEYTEPSSTSSSFGDANLKPVLLGTRDDRYSYMDGSISQWCMWDRTLTAMEILSLYSLPWQGLV